jgi:diguanylate cyclase (GGDEF)-like protein
LIPHAIMPFLCIFTRPRLFEKFGATATPPEIKSDIARAHPRRRFAALRRELGRWLQHLSTTGATLVALGLMLCVAAGDHISGPDVSFTLLYLGPIGFATWFVSLPAGITLSIASAVASLGVDVATRNIALAGAVLAWNFGVQLGVFLALVALLAALKNRLEAEQRLARTDPVTGVSNRRAFLEMAVVEMERARRTGRPLTVAYFDADDFKAINDQYGHALGDAVLLSTASTLREQTRAVDGVARLGGDEFGLLLVDTDGPAANTLLQRLRAALLETMARNGWPVTFSIGAATFASPPRSLDEMLRHADQLMYDAKRSGKDAARFEVVEWRPTLVRDAPAAR